MKAPQGASKLGIVGFTSPAFALAALGLPVLAILPPLYTELGISLTAVGLIFGVARFFDVFTDPLFGVFGDRIETRWGRRRPAIVLGIPVLMLGAVGLFFPANPASSILLLFSLLVLYIGWTLLAIAHTAWAAELSNDYHQRTRIMGALQFWGLLGAVIVLAIPAMVDQFNPAGGMQLRAEVMGWLILASILVFFTVSLRSMPEPKVPPQPHIGLTAAWAAITANPGLKRIVIANLLLGLQGGINGSVHFFFINQVLGLPEAASLFLVLIFVTGLTFVPFFVWLSGRIGKHQTLCIGALQSTVATGLFFVAPSADFWWVLFIFILVGVNFGAQDLLMRSIMADVVDQDRVNTGADRGALYYSMLTLTNKLGAGLAVLIIYPILDLVGFDAGGVNSQATLDAVRLVVASSPTTITLIVAIIMWRFPIDQAQQEALRAQIDRTG
ncbi:MAG: MFS transporter [Pseudomonadota bacterium]